MYGRKTGRCYISADMIYLKNESAAQMVRIPSSGLGEGQEAPVLVLWSTVDNREVYELAWAGAQAEPGYLTGTVSLPEGLSDGEYEYRLAEGRQVLSSGVAQVGEYAGVPVPPKESKTITFKQYGRKD